MNPNAPDPFHCAPPTDRLHTLQFALDAVSDSVCVLSPDTRYLLVNSAWCRMAGQPQDSVQERVIGRRPQDAFAAIVSPERQQAFDQCLASREKQILRSQFASPEKGQRTLETTFSPFINERGHVWGVALVSRDVTEQRLRDLRRRQDDAAQRDALVREVQHRIKNNLQGISGLLRQFAREEPLAAPALNQAISQVNSIATLHGLQARADSGGIVLGTLLSAILMQLQDIWRMPMDIQLHEAAEPLLINETEAVPLALVLNELLINALKHADAQLPQVQVALHCDLALCTALVLIRNRGRLPPPMPKQSAGEGAAARTTRKSARSGHPLVHSMMPRHGAQLQILQEGDMVVTRLHLQAPTLLRGT